MRTTQAHFPAVDAKSMSISSFGMSSSGFTAQVTHRGAPGFFASSDGACLALPGDGAHKINRP